jgi:thiol-disulfide isomerase/thioredoxin
MLFSVCYLEMCYHVLVILLVLLVVLRLIPRYERFESPVSVIICKAEWCGHCKAAAPEFQKLVRASPISLHNGKQAHVTMLDADGDKDSIGQYKVRGYPTILVNNGGEPMEYPGPRTYDGVIEYLNAM